MTTSETFPAKQVITLRHSLGLTQVELAKRLGVSQPLIALWEKGQRTPQGPAAILLRQLSEKKSRKLKTAS